MRFPFSFLIGKQSKRLVSHARHIRCQSLSALATVTTPENTPRRSFGLPCHHSLVPGRNAGCQQRKFSSPPHSFNTEGQFHMVANETLERIQDAVEEALEDNGISEPFEVTLSDGVLTLVLPPHGTWVINKQTPNRQLWWSSPLSGPRRYEYEGTEWVYTRDNSHSINLIQTLQEEIQQIYQIDMEDI